MTENKIESHGMILIAYELIKESFTDKKPIPELDKCLTIFCDEMLRCSDVPFEEIYANWELEAKNNNVPAQNRMKSDCIKFIDNENKNIFIINLVKKL